MIRAKRLGLALAAIATLAAASATIIAAADAAAPASRATPPATRPAPAFAAMDYYDQNCAKCHGPQGAFYGSSLGADLTDQGLIKEVRDMADGPAQSHLEEPDVLVETAFHRALITHTPYLSVTQMDGQHWSGEIMPDATLTLTIAGKKISTKIDNWTWSATLPPDTNPADVTLKATLQGKTTTLHPTHSTYSHQTPLPPPAERKHP